MDGYPFSLFRTAKDTRTRHRVKFAVMDRLEQAAINVPGVEVRVIERCASTNAVLMAERSGHPVLLAAEEQTAGRGQRGRPRGAARGRGGKKRPRPGLRELRKRLSPELVKNQFYRRERLVGLAQKAIDWDSSNPRDYDQRWITRYGKVAAASAGTDPGELLLPESEWPAILKRVHAAHLQSVQAFAAEKKTK